MQSIFDDVIRKMLMPAKIFQQVLQAYMMLYIITMFRVSGISQSKVKVGEGYAFHLVEIQFTYCLHLQKGLELFN